MQPTSNRERTHGSFILNILNFMAYAYRVDGPVSILSHEMISSATSVEWDIPRIYQYHAANLR
jgi:hypothetical protein